MGMSEYKPIERIQINSIRLPLCVRVCVRVYCDLYCNIKWKFMLTQFCEMTYWIHFILICCFSGFLCLGRENVSRQRSTSQNRGYPKVSIEYDVATRT
jgi:hypothetical protein